MSINGEIGYTDARARSAIADLINEIGKLLKDLECEDHSLKNVKSIDGGGDDVVFHDDIRMGVNGSEIQYLTLYGTTAGRYVLMHSSGNQYYGALTAYLSHYGTGRFDIQTKDTGDTLKTRLRINYGDTPDVDILNAKLDLNGNPLKKAVIGTDTAIVEGALRWNATTHKPEVYNGIEWKVLQYE